MDVLIIGWSGVQGLSMLSCMVDAYKESNLCLAALVVGNILLVGSRSAEISA